MTVGGSTGGCAKGAEQSTTGSTSVCCWELVVDTGTSDSTPTGIGSLTVDCPSPTEAAGHDKLSSLLNGSLSSAWTSKYSIIFLVRSSKSGISFQSYR